MRKFTPEEEAYFIAKAEEAERCDELYGTMTEEEFWADIKKFDEELRRERQLKRKNMKLHIPNLLTKISKRFVRI